eukprot:scaffold19741_cov38-Prasinocladus_malaysianus.AAC.1
MVHTLCEDPGSQCPASAWEIAQEWPECINLLQNGGGDCTAGKARQHFDEAVKGLCAPFGPADYPSMF